MGQAPRVLSTDPNAGEPLRTSGGAPRVLSTDPDAGEPLRVVTRGSALDHPHVQTARVAGDLVKGAWNAVSAIPASIAGMVRTQAEGPQRVTEALSEGEYGEAAHQAINTYLLPFVGPMVEGLVKEHLRLGSEARTAIQEGNYGTAAIKGVEALTPVVGPVVDPSVEKIRAGQIAEGTGELVTNAAMLAAGGRSPARITARARVPGLATVEDVVEFARKEGIPLDAGTATSSQFVKNLQKKVASSWGGAGTAETAQAAQGEALAAAAHRLASRANGGGPAVGPVEAGESVRAALESRMKGFHGEANRAYGRLREAEAAAPEELVQARPPKPAAASHVTPEQSFALRWLAEDLEQFQFQPSSRMRGARATDEWQKAATAEEFNQAVYSPRVAGTPVQEMFHAMGINGSRPEIAVKIEKFLSGQSKDARFVRLADAMNEAWDGRRFDFDLVSDETLTHLGIRRRDLKSPIGVPDYAEAGASSFFPDSEYVIPAAPRSAAGSEKMRLAVDLRSAKESMRPVLRQLEREREITGVLHGDKGKAALALEGLVNGPDYAPLSTVDAALGPIKKIAHADIPQLRSRGQGLLARMVSELDTAIRDRAQAAPGDAAQSLHEGRTATRMKYQTADAMKLLGVRGEPRAVFARLTANKDAGITKLRELQTQTPDQVPTVARALLEDILERPTSEGGFKFADKAAADWARVGPETKRILFPDPGHVKALDSFFRLAKSINANPNPSGTAQVMNATNILAGIPMYALSKMLFTPRGVRALTGAMEISVSTRPAAQAAAMGQLARAAQEAGVTLKFPKAAEVPQDRQRETARPVP